MLNEREKELLIRLIKEDKKIPLDYKYSLFPPEKAEYELVYANKARKEDILADTMEVPLQQIKTFGTNGKNWHNLLIFGDNLQVLKTIYEDKDPVIKGKIKHNVKLIYIDPPFATKQEFRGGQDQKAYQDKIAGAQFLEFLRKRLIFLREILSDDGCIFVHLDYRKKHYIKALMDEIFFEGNFRNEIAINRIKKNVRERERVKKLNEEFDTILFYSKSEQLTILPPMRKETKPDRWHAFDAAGFRTGMDYEIFGFTPAPTRHWHWSKKKAFEAKRNYEAWQEKYSEKETLGAHWLRAGKKLQFVRPNQNTGKPEYFIPASEESLCNNLWNDISGYSFNFQYPTEKSEPLLERIVNINAQPGDLIMDCFCGSGTTLAVAEKLGMRWVGIDCGKLALYTIQKRLLSLKDDNKKPIQCKSFALYNAGLYDYKMIKELDWESYRSFSLSLFQCRDDKHKISGIQLDGFLNKDDVLVFNYQEHKKALITEDYIDDLHKHFRGKIGKRFFIIAPSASVDFLEDYILKGDTKYYILRIPYSIIKELHDNFGELKQPMRESDVNETVDAVGFDFIQPPNVDCKYYLDKPKNPDLFSSKDKECVIEIKKFESKILSKKPQDFTNLETLSMIMVDWDYDGEVFDFDAVYYAEDIKPEYEVRFPVSKVKDEIMLIYLDIFGNEKREVKTLKDFK